MPESFGQNAGLPVRWDMFCFNTLRPRQNCHHFAEGIFKCIFLTENVWTSLNISLKFVHKVLISNIPALPQILTWRRPGDKPLFEAMVVSLLTHLFTGWSSVHRNGTGQPSEYLRGTLEHHWKNLVETAPHWNATWKNLTIAAYTETPLEGL